MIPPMAYRGVRTVPRTYHHTLRRWGPRDARTVFGFQDIPNPRRRLGELIYAFQDAYLIPFILAAEVPRLSKVDSTEPPYSLDKVTDMLGLSSHHSNYPLWLKHILCVGLQVNLGELLPAGFEIEICVRESNNQRIPNWVRYHYEEYFG